MSILVPKLKDIQFNMILNIKEQENNISKEAENSIFCNFCMEKQL